MKKKMKTFSCLIVIFFIFQICSIYCQASQRGIRPEAVALEIFFKGKCSEIQEIVKSIRISSHDNNSTCLPLSSPQNVDFNELSFHHLCTNIDYRGRVSLLRLVEIFNGTYDNPLPAGYSYIISLVSPIPFKVKYAGVRYVLLPTCSFLNDICTPSKYVVTNCIDREVDAHSTDVQGFVLNKKERIYVIFPEQTIQTCVNDNGVCCSYITPDDQGLCKPESYFESLSDPHSDDHYQSYDNHNSYNQPNPSSYGEEYPPQAPPSHLSYNNQNQAPNYQAPVQQAPDYQAPVQQTPDYQAPSANYQAPVNQAPDYQAPVQQTPDYQAPSHPTPNYQAPSNHAPNYGQNGLNFQQQYKPSHYDHADQNPNLHFAQDQEDEDEDDK